MSVFAFIHLKTGRVLKYRIDAFSLTEAVMQFIEERHVGSDTFMKLNKGPKALCTAPSRSNPEGIDIIHVGTWSRLVKDIKPKTVKTGSCLCSQLLLIDNCGWFLLAGYDNGSLSVFYIDMINISVRELMNIQVFAETILCLDSVLLASKLHLVCGGPANNIKLLRLDLSESGCTASANIHAPLSHAGAASISMTSQLVVVGGWDTSISVYTSSSLAELTRITRHSDTLSQVQIVEFSRGVQSSVRPSLRYNELCFTASYDGCIQMWDLSKCKIETINN